MFSDIKGHWAVALIDSLAQDGKVSGDGNNLFNPDKFMTRAEFSALIVRVFNPAPTRPAIVFSDVPANHWAFKAIRQAYQAGYLSGFPNSTFKPNESISRQDAITSLASRNTGIGTPNLALLNRYIDAAKVSDYARPGIARATQRGWILNYPNLEALNPKLPATRAEVAGMIRLITSDQYNSIYAVRNLFAIA
ncbi:MAG: S-layer homology domain-containing protein [Myxacorys chilensis ATA2-1-KO14]|jgi:hypothetical protein|nr:S-layer homology domain-containing protein [Myxacorys chilensis ATA2-1-KO14]